MPDASPPFSMKARSCASMEKGSEKRNRLRTATRVSTGIFDERPQIHEWSYHVKYWYNQSETDYIRSLAVCQ